MQVAEARNEDTRRPRARELTEAAIQRIVDDLCAGKARGDVAERHGVSTSAVGMISRRVHPKMTLDQKRAISGGARGEDMQVVEKSSSPPVAIVKPQPEGQTARELVCQLRDAMTREGICEMAMRRDADGVVRCDITRFIKEEW